MSKHIVKDQPYWDGQELHPIGATVDVKPNPEHLYLVPVKETTQRGRPAGQPDDIAE